MTELEKIIDKIDSRYIELNDGKQFVITGAARYFYKERLTIHVVHAFSDNCFYDYTKYFARLEKEAENISSSGKLCAKMRQLADNHHIVAISLKGLPIDYINKKLEETDCNIRKFTAIYKNLTIIDEINEV